MQTICDYYRCTIPADSGRLIDFLECSLFADVEPSSPKVRGFYDQGVWLVRGESKICHVSFGGENPDPLVTAEGSNSPEVMNLIRKNYPAHKVSRFDSAIDISGDSEFFNDFSGTLSDIARSLRIKTKPPFGEVDGYGVNLGRTMCVGSRNSAVMVRMYEKGLQMKNKGIFVDGHKDDWVRVELELKPSKVDQKCLAAALDSDQVWGASEMSRRVFQLLTHEDVSRFKPGTIPRKTDRERALEFMLIQYKRTFQHLLEDNFGSWELLGAELGERYNELHKTNSEIKASPKDDFVPF